MTESEIKELVEYWSTSASHDKRSMDSLYKSGEYSNALFFGHIILEKILKALVVQATREPAPYTHDLVMLKDAASIDMSEAEQNLIDEVNHFNIRARYPDFKLAFYKKCTREFAKPYYEKIESFYERLCQQLTQK
ncbi:MAG: DNA-binding protein [Candidatus Vogelbacteria bacterium CG10_big_fil_rev_8_21_14_0_10_45_14]|uniref:DNA-binding protein n=1 Tax=Candidatus Vogelbacteria bacterium CG10_big_fil_rev_8_21_14_0_10_45_14 TaxID=1975042 RepID=A0A2H0RKJ4_9BACT|nr:MAG: DNA-binding protein [Candidatus Vogelbacteria bacterium CG10_big_fil_rev_8_21_14_0_10_45_14]